MNLTASTTTLADLDQSNQTDNHKQARSPTWQTNSSVLLKEHAHYTIDTIDYGNTES